MYLDERSSVPRAHFHIVQTLRELKPAAQRQASAAAAGPARLFPNYRATSGEPSMPSAAQPLSAAMRGCATLDLANYLQFSSTKRLVVPVAKIKPKSKNPVPISCSTRAIPKSSM